MSVSIVCDKCEKRLNIPETVVGRSIKCPACGAVFKADPARVQAGTARPAPKPARPEPEDGAPPSPRTGEEDVRPAKKKALPDEEAADVVPIKKSAVIIEDDDEEPPPPRRGRRVDDYDDYEDEEEPRGKPATPWYVMLPLLILSFSAIGLALLWTIGFDLLGMDFSMTFDSRMWVGIGIAVHVTLLCLIFSLMPTRAWVRFVIVLLLLALAYGESWAVVRYWKQLPFGKEEKPAAPVNMPGGRGGPPFQPPGGGPDDGGP
jgi:hypothetical protein